MSNAVNLGHIWSDFGIANELRFADSQEARETHTNAMSEMSSFYGKSMGCEIVSGQAYDMALVSIDEVRAYVMITGRFMIIAMFNMSRPMSILGSPELLPKKGVYTIALVGEEWDIAAITAQLSLRI